MSAPYRLRVAYTHGSIAKVVTARRRYACQNHLSQVEKHFIEPGQQYVRNSLPPHNPDIGNEGWWFSRHCLDCCPTEWASRAAAETHSTSNTGSSKAVTSSEDVTRGEGSE